MPSLRYSALADLVFVFSNYQNLLHAMMVRPTATFAEALIALVLCYARCWWLRLTRGIGACVCTVHSRP